MEGFQLWVNLPAKNKMDSPAYQDVPPEEIPIVDTKHYSIRVIAGEYNGVAGAIVTKTPIMLLDVRFKPREEGDDKQSDESSKQFFTIADSIPRNMNLMGYVYRGKIAFSDSPKSSFGEGSTILFGHTTSLSSSASSTIDDKDNKLSSTIKVEARSVVEDESKKSTSDTASKSSSSSSIVDDDGFTSRMLLIGGVPIKEPITKYGPFVMNTEEEIMKAFDDYQNGKLAKKPIEGAAEELAKTRRAKMMQLQSGTWNKDEEAIKR